MDTRLKQVPVVLRWVIGTTMLSLVFGGIAIFPANAFGKGRVTTTQNQSQHDVGKLVSPSWKVVSSPNGGGQNILNAVAAVSANDVWAVGNYYNSTGYAQTLIEHWNGSNWSVVSSPDVGLADSLSAVTAVSANDVWAVGFSSTYSNGSFHYHTLIEHWKGTSWRLVSSPNVGTIYNSLHGVAAVSSSDVWAVGTYDTIENNGSVNQTLIEQWNGTSWSIVSSPNIGTNNNSFNSVAVISANDVWAVGAYDNNLGSSQTLIEQWNGTIWNVVSSPNTGAGDTLTSVAVVSTSDIWAVGNSFNTGNTKTLTMHWNGTSWSIVTSPNVKAFNYLRGVAAISTNNIWAVGYVGKFGPLVEHYS